MYRDYRVISKIYNASLRLIAATANDEQTIGVLKSGIPNLFVEQMPPLVAYSALQNEALKLLTAKWGPERAPSSSNGYIHMSGACEVFDVPIVYTRGNVPTGETSLLWGSGKLVKFSQFDRPLVCLELGPNQEYGYFIPENCVDFSK